MNRYFYAIESDRGIQLLHLYGIVYDCDSEEPKNHRCAEWTHFYLEIEEAQGMLEDGSFFDYVGERVDYIGDITKEEAEKICCTYFSGQSGTELHISDITEDTPLGDYWFDYDYEEFQQNQTTFEIKVTRKLKIKKEDIDDIMVGALEGGITYWANKAEVVGEYLGEFASDQISRGGTLRIHDSYDKKWHELTLKKLLNGIRNWYTDGLDRHGVVQCDGTFDCCNVDSVVADSIIQYAIFGEIIYA